MTQKRALILCALAAYLLNSCSNEFDLTAPWKEIPVVYAIISPADTAHYIRVEKAFLDETTSAFTIADIADSIYYPADAINVFLRKKGQTKLYPLNRVDGNIEGIVRDTGIFATSPNWLYKIKPAELDGGLQEGSTYELIIRRTNGGPDITAETNIPGAFQLSSPLLTQIPPRIDFQGSLGTTIKWRHDANAVFFNVTLVIRYREEALNGSLLGRDTLYWQVALNELQDKEDATSIEIIGTEFYSFLNRNIAPATDRRRYFDRLDIIVEGGGREIRDYQLTAQANAGLTGAEIIRTYSNMSEGYGIFTAKNRSVFTGLRIWQPTVDSMNLNSLTSGLNFKF